MAVNSKLQSLALAFGLCRSACVYIRISAFRRDRAARQAFALFSLYRDAATAATDVDGRRALVPVVAKLRVDGRSSRLGLAMRTSATPCSVPTKPRAPSRSWETTVRRCSGTRRTRELRGQVQSRRWSEAAPEREQAERRQEKETERRR